MSCGTCPRVCHDPFLSEPPLPLRQRALFEGIVECHLPVPSFDRVHFKPSDGTRFTKQVPKYLLLPSFEHEVRAITPGAEDLQRRVEGLRGQEVVPHRQTLTIETQATGMLHREKYCVGRCQGGDIVTNSDVLLLPLAEDEGASLLGGRQLATEDEQHDERRHRKLHRRPEHSSKVRE